MMETYNEKKKIYARAYRKNHKEKFLFLAAKDRAKKQGLEFNIEEIDITIPIVCPVFGMQIINGDKITNNSSPSVDRVDNAKGYIKGNIKVISWRANIIKGDATLLELEKVRDYMYNAMENTDDRNTK